MIDTLQTIDMKALEYVDKRLRNPLLDRIMPIITSAGNLGAVWILTSLLFIESRKYRVEGIMIISSLCLTTIIGEGIIKHLVRRARPFIAVKEDSLLIARPITYSFPSGHSASSFAAAGIFVAMNNPFSSAAVICAALIAFSRLYLKVHYLIDVVSGILLGILCSMIVLCVF